MGLKHQEELLRQCADQLKQHSKVRVGTLEVTLRERPGDEGYVFGFVEFMNAMASNLYWDERGNWSDCSLLELRVI